MLDMLDPYWAIRFEFRDDTPLIGEWTNRTDGPMIIESIENSLPQPNYVFVDVPGKDSAIDLSRAVSGKVSTGQGKLTIKMVDSRWLNTPYNYMSDVVEMLTIVDYVRRETSGRPCWCTIGNWSYQNNDYVFVPEVFVPEEYSTGELFLTEYNLTHGRIEFTFEFTYGVDA